MEFVVDESRWPIVLVTVAAGVPSDEGFEAYIARLATMLARREPFAVVANMQLGGIPSPRHRERIRAFHRAHLSEIRQCLRGMAFVAPSFVSRALVTALNQLTRPPFPMRAFRDESTAIAWVAACTRGSNASANATTR